jgi:hypothetical protein
VVGRARGERADDLARRVQPHECHLPEVDVDLPRPQLALEVDGRLNVDELRHHEKPLVDVVDHARPQRGEEGHSAHGEHHRHQHHDDEDEPPADHGWVRRT